MPRGKKPNRWHWVHTRTLFRLDHRRNMLGGTTKEGLARAKFLNLAINLLRDTVVFKRVQPKHYEHELDYRRTRYKGVVFATV